MTHSVLLLVFHPPLSSSQCCRRFPSLASCGGGGEGEKKEVAPSLSSLNFGLFPPSCENEIRRKCHSSSKVETCRETNFGNSWRRKRERDPFLSPLNVHFEWLKKSEKGKKEKEEEGGDFPLTLIILGLG